jgi:hypothetical protein
MRLNKELNELQCRSNIIAKLVINVKVKMEKQRIKQTIRTMKMFSEKAKRLIVL